MASQFVAQAQAQEQAETCLNEAQTEAAILIDTHLNIKDGSFTSKAGHINVADGAPQAAVSNPDWWQASADALPCVTGGRYVIEYLGIRDMVLPDNRFTGITHKMHALRITAQGTAASGTHVALQAIFLRNSL